MRKRGGRYTTTFSPLGRMRTDGCLGSPGYGFWAAIASPFSAEPTPQEQTLAYPTNKERIMETTAGTDQALTEKVLNAYSNIESPRLKLIVSVRIKHLRANA